MSDRDAVAAANAAFYRAFETLDVREMEKVWLPDADVKCIHPGWPLLTGWGPVMASWERIFANTQSMRFDLSDLHVHAAGDMGWVVLIENLESQTEQGSGRSRILTTNLFERRDGRWFIVHHHGSPIFAPPTPAEDRLQ